MLQNLKILCVFNGMSNVYLLVYVKKLTLTPHNRRKKWLDFSQISKSATKCKTNQNLIYVTNTESS